MWEILEQRGTFQVEVSNRKLFYSSWHDLLLEQVFDTKHVPFEFPQSFQ